MRDLELLREQIAEARSAVDDLDARRRIMILDALKRGEKPDALAVAAGLSVTMVYRVRREENLGHGKGGRRPRLFTPAERAELDRDRAAGMGLRKLERKYRIGSLRLLETLQGASA